MVSHNSRCGAVTKNGKRCKKVINHGLCMKRGITTTRFCTQHRKQLLMVDVALMTFVDWAFSSNNPDTFFGTVMDSMKKGIKEGLRFSTFSAKSYKQLPFKNFNQGMIEGLYPHTASQFTE